MTEADIFASTKNSRHFENLQLDLKKHQELAKTRFAHRWWGIRCQFAEKLGIGRRRRAAGRGHPWAGRMGCPAGGLRGLGHTPPGPDEGLPGPGGDLSLSLTWPPSEAHVCGQDWLQGARKLVCPWGTQGTELRLSPIFAATELCGCG